MKTICEFLLKNKTAASTQDTDYVDLGLPSGLLWTKCNIGADKPYEYGDYFMWGSTKPDTDKSCKPKCMPFNNDNDYYDKDYFESIKNKVCPNGVLAPEYDAATVILGHDWRLPTYDDFKELIDNANHEWIKNYKGSKVNGILFKQNNAELGHELFIPAAGYRNGSRFNFQGSYVYLWSSSLYTSIPYYARFLYFDDFSCDIAYDYRYFGFCLRGVKEN